MGSMREKCGVSPTFGVMQPSVDAALALTAFCGARITPPMRTTLRNTAAVICGIITISS